MTSPDRLVRVSVVTDDLGGDHEGRDEEAVTGQASGGGETAFQPRKKEERTESDALVEVSAVMSVDDEHGEGGCGGRRSARR
jgi:hypothetical protein